MEQNGTKHPPFVGICLIFTKNSGRKNIRCTATYLVNFSPSPFYRMGRVSKWNWTDYVRHHFEDGQYLCSQASQTPITIHILKAYDESYSKIIREHKQKDKDKDNNKEKDTSWSLGQLRKPGQPGQTGQTGKTGQTELTLKLAFPGNLCRAAFAVLTMFFSLCL